MKIEDLILQNESDRKTGIRQNANYTVLSVHDALPEYVTHEKFDNFLQNSLASQDAILEKFYKFILNKDDNFKEKVQNINNLNLESINALLLITKPRNIKKFSLIISLLNKINDFLKGENSDFAYALNKILDDNIDMEYLRRFITKDSEEEDQNFAKYVYKFFLGFNNSNNESDYYNDIENSNFVDLNNTTFLLTLINMANVYFSSGLLHTRNHSLEKFFNTQANSIYAQSESKNFKRNKDYANIIFSYQNILSDKNSEIEIQNYKSPGNYARDLGIEYTNLYKTKFNNFNIFENLGSNNKTGNFSLLDDENEDLIASSRCKDLIDLDIAFDKIPDPYKLLIKPLISSNINASIDDAFFYNNINASTVRRSISRASYALFNKLFQNSNLDNSDSSFFIENLKHYIGHAKTVYFSSILKNEQDNILSFFYQKSIKNDNPRKKIDQDLLGVSFQNSNSYFQRNRNNELDAIFTKNEIDLFESNNKISSLKKGIDNLNLNNTEFFDEIIEQHENQKKSVEESIDRLFENKKTSSTNFYKNILEKSVEGIRESLTRIATTSAENSITYYPAHLLEEISFLVRFNSNNNIFNETLSKDKNLFIKNLVSLFYHSANKSNDLTVLSDFYTNSSRSSNSDSLKIYIETKGSNFNYLNNFIDNNVERSFLNLDLGGIRQFVTNLCNGNSEVEFLKKPFDKDKHYTYNNESMYTPRYYQSLGHVYSDFYSSAKRQKYQYGYSPSQEFQDKFNDPDRFYYIPFVGFIKGSYYDGFFAYSTEQFNYLKLENNNIFSQLKPDGYNKGIFRSFIDLLESLIKDLNDEDKIKNDQMEFFIFNLFKAYSQLILIQLTNLFEYTSLLHIPKMISEGPLEVARGLGVGGEDTRYNLFRNRFDGYNSRFANPDLSNPGEVKAPQRNDVYPPKNPGSSRRIVYANAFEDFRPSLENILNYINASGLDNYLNNNVDFQNSLADIIDKYKDAIENQEPEEGGLYELTDSALIVDLFCKKVNTGNNTDEDALGGLDSEDCNGNVWFDYLYNEAKTYDLLPKRDKVVWKTTHYPYNYPLLKNHNHILSFYNGFIAITIEKLIEQIDTNFLFVKEESFEKDAIYGPLSKVHNAFLSEDLTVSFLFDAIRYSFNHFKFYKEFLEDNVEESERVINAKELLSNLVSKYYENPEDFNIDDYISSISMSQKLSIINKFRIDTQERVNYYSKLVNNNKAKINSRILIENYINFKNKIVQRGYDKILTIGVDQNLLDISNGQIQITLRLKDFVYKKKNTNELTYIFDVNSFGSNIILNQESFTEALDDNPGNNPNNILSEQCRDYLTIATGHSISDSNMFLNTENLNFNSAELAHFSQETYDLLTENLPLINNFYAELNNLLEENIEQDGEFFYLLDNIDYSNETDLYLYENSAKTKIKKDIVKRLALFDYLIFSNDVIGRRCLPRQFPRIFYLPINTNDFYDEQNLRYKNVSDITVEIEPL